MRRVTLLSSFSLMLLSIFISPSVGWGQEQFAPPPATAITGVYNGSYRCARGPVVLKLTLVAPGGGSLTGVFTFDLPPNSPVRTASFTLSGTYDSTTGKFRLNPVKWEPPQPPGFVMVGMDGSFNSSTEKVSGKLTYPTCSTFEATRNKGESTALAGRPAVTPPSTGVASVAPPKSTTPAVPAAQPPTAATLAQPAETAPAEPSRHAGTYLLYCSSMKGPDVYISDKFEVQAFGNGENGAPGMITMAFHQFLHEKYSLPAEYQLAPVSCGVDSGPGGAQHSIPAVEANVEASAKEGKKIVKTGWKYVGTLPPIVPR